MKDVSLAVCHKAVCCCVIDRQSELPLYPWEHAGYSHTFFFFFFSVISEQLFSFSEADGEKAGDTGWVLEQELEQRPTH